MSTEEPFEEESDLYGQDERPRLRRRKSGRSGTFWFIAVGVVAVCVIGGLLLSTLFAGAVITIYPRTQSVTAPVTLSAQINAPVGTLPYALLTVVRYATTTVTASGSKQVSRQASGTITIYNAAGTASQRLIANTRFAAPDGKIYRIHDSVTVPGGSKNADGTIAPGTINATVYADSAGADYNRGETRFTIPGFKDDPRYAQFYAIAHSISNGFVGQEPAIAPADLSKAQAAMQQALDGAVRSALASQIPEGFLPIPGTLKISYSSMTQTPSDATTASVSQSATALEGIVKASSLAAAVAKEGKVDGYKGEAVEFADASQVSMVATSTTVANTINITLTGIPTLVWQYDAGALKQALLGKPKSTFQSIVESFGPAIAKAEAKVRPFWQSSFPSDPNKITLTQGK
jgi:hypothetical protein